MVNIFFSNKMLVLRVIMILCLFLAHHCQVPNANEWANSNYDYRSDPDWDNIPNVFETLVHKNEESYKPMCAVNPEETYTIPRNCTKIKPKALPPSPFARCRILINEVNTDNPGDENQNLFIELAEYCFDNPTKRASSLKGFKLIIVGGASEKIEAVIDLKDTKLPDWPTSNRRYVVIGTDNVPNVVVKLSNTKVVQSVFNNPGHRFKLPVGDSEPFGIILLWSNSLRDLSRIKLSTIPETNFYEPTIITPELEATIRKFNQDQVVYGRRTPTNRCDIFEKLWHDATILKPNFRYLLRDWDSSNPTGSDLSLSRCTELSHPFTPDFFKLAEPTPGTINRCDGASRFLLEEQLEKVSNLLWKEFPPPLAVPEQCSSDQINIPNERYLLVSEEKYIGARDESIALAKRSCFRDDGPGASYAAEEMEVDINNEILEHLNAEPMIPPYSMDNFKPEWIDLAAPFLPPQEKSILDQPEIQSWLRIVSTPTAPVRFSCEVCSTMVNKHFKIERNHNKDIMKPTGFLSKEKAKNRNEIIEHNQDHVHFQSEAFLREIWATETKKLVMQMIMDKDTTASKLLLPTISMMRTSFMEATVAIPFNKHEHLVRLQKINGVNLGIRHSSRTAAEQMTSTLSDYFHDSLLQHLIDNDKDISIIVDGSTDTMNIPYLTVHFQTITDNRPQVFFYRVIELDQGESAKAIKNSLWQKIKDDSTEDRNFEDYLRRHLVSFSSDGANVMIGRKESLWVLLKKEIGRDFPFVICMAHKLENSIKRGIKSSTDPDLVYFSKFNKEINRFYVFYSSRGSKRWAHFEQTALELGIRPNRIKYFFDIRWSASHFKCLDNLYKNYVALIEDTGDIATNSSFTKAANAEAESLNQKLHNKSWVLVLHEFLDMLTVYKFVSLDLQVQAGILPGKASIIQIAVTKLEMLKMQTGAYVNSLLKTATCPLTPCASSSCTMAEYENCGTIVYDGKYQLTDNDEEYIALSNKREVLYDSIISGLKHYFNLEELRRFEIFNQKAYPIPLCDTSNYGILFNETQQTDDLKGLGLFYGMSAAEILNMQENWSSFVTDIIFSMSFNQNRHTEFEVFWPLILKSGQKEIPHLTPPIAKLISKMLVTPFSSAEAERAFSFLTREKSGNRASMTPETLDKIMRLSLNGRMTYATFDALEPTLNWLKFHSRVDDPSFQQSRDGKAHEWNNFLPRSSIF